MAKQLQKLIVTLEAESSRLTSQLEKSTKRLKKWENKASKSVDSVKKAFVGLAATVGIGAIAKSVFSTVASFEKMEASLKTVTGSAENAAGAMRKIQKFTSETPFQVSEVTNAFIKLKALGLTPSEEALKSYGNTASALGKSLDQMIEAVADAATGEFERLKEFGIKAKQQGDFVTFTFQGVATKIRKNAADIEGYLQGIGEVQFAGAMAEQMDTISGKSSNLEDNIDRLFLALGDAGLNKVFKDSIDSMIRFTKAMAESGTFVNAIVTPIEFLIKTVRTVALTFEDLGDKIGAFAAATTMALKFDLDGLKSVIKLQEETAKLREAEFEAIWAKVAATEELGKVEAKNAAAKIETGATGEAAQKELDDLQEQIAAKFIMLDESLLAENERLMLAHENRQLIIEEAFQFDLLNIQQRDALLESLEEKHQKKLIDIQNKSLSAQERLWNKGWKGKLKVTSQVLGALSNLMQSENKKQFEIGKKAAIAQTVINTYEMATSSYKALAGIPIVGPVLGAIAAGAAILYGKSQVSSIKSQSFGGGGVAGGAPSIPTTSSNPSTGLPEGSPGDVGVDREPTKIVNISITGNPTGEQVRDLIEMINVEQGNGAVLNATVAV